MKFYYKRAEKHSKCKVAKEKIPQICLYELVMR
jgi:hypothetical protein